MLTVTKTCNKKLQVTKKKQKQFKKNSIHVFLVQYYHVLDKENTDSIIEGQRINAGLLAIFHWKSFNKKNIYILATPLSSATKKLK